MAEVRSIERVSRTILAQQKQVDALEAEGRSFRADIGRALDQLVLDRSRERALAEAASHRLASLGDAPGEQAGRSYDAALWETAALKVTCGSSEVAADDISFQIEALQHRLLERNLAHERDVVEASGALEGALAAARHLTHELDRLLEQASSELGEHSASGSWRQAAGEPGPRDHSSHRLSGPAAHIVAFKMERNLVVSRVELAVLTPPSAPPSLSPLPLPPRARSK